VVDFEPGFTECRYADDTSAIACMALRIMVLFCIRKSCDTDICFSKTNSYLHFEDTKELAY